MPKDGNLITVSDVGAQKYEEVPISNIKEKSIHEADMTF